MCSVLGKTFLPTKFHPTDSKLSNRWGYLHNVSLVGIVTGVVACIAKVAFKRGSFFLGLLIVGTSSLAAYATQELHYRQRFSKGASASGGVPKSLQISTSSETDELVKLRNERSELLKANAALRKQKEFIPTLVSKEYCTALANSFVTLSKLTQKNLLDSSLTNAAEAPKDFFETKADVLNTFSGTSEQLFDLLKDLPSHLNSVEARARPVTFDQGLLRSFSSDDDQGIPGPLPFAVTPAPAALPLPIVGVQPQAQPLRNGAIPGASTDRASPPESDFDMLESFLPDTKNAAGAAQKTTGRKK